MERAEQQQVGVRAPATSERERLLLLLLLPLTVEATLLLCGAVSIVLNRLGDPLATLLLLESVDADGRRLQRTMLDHSSTSSSGDRQA